PQASDHGRYRRGQPRGSPPVPAARLSQGSAFHRTRALQGRLGQRIPVRDAAARMGKQPMRSRLASRFSAIRRLLFLIALTLPAAALADLRADMQHALAEEDLTGAVWATVMADGAIAVDAAGVANARSGER